MKRFSLVIGMIALAASLLAGCQNGGGNLSASPSAVAGDKLYVPEGYQAQLAQMHLTEIAALPYFTKPFITVAHDDTNQQWAVLFQSSTEARKVKLPKTYEEIQKTVEKQGFIVNATTVSNLHLFEHDKRLFWAFTDGTGTLYLDLDGKKTDPFEKQD